MRFKAYIGFIFKGKKKFLKLFIIAKLNLFRKMHNYLN